MIDLVDPPDVFGSTIFCDDIRQETSGKFIYIGVYQSSMLINTAFPIRLSRMSFAITLMQSVDIFEPSMKFRVFLPGDSDDKSSVETEFSETEAGAAAKNADAASDAAGIPQANRNFVTINHIVTFENFEIKEPGVIKVRVDIGGKRYRLGSIQVAQADKPSA